MNKEYIFKTLKETIIEILPDVDETSIILEESLRNLGANSIDRMDIIIDTLKKLDMKVPMMQFNECKNIEDIVDTLLAFK